MSSPRVVSFRIEPEKVAELDKLAKAMDRDRTYVINEALVGYISEQQRFVALVEEGLEASRNGSVIDDEEVGKLLDVWEHKNATRKRA
jgi:predicted transcriptional regulator